MKCSFCEKDGFLVRKEPPTCKKCYNQKYKRPQGKCINCNKVKEIHTKNGFCDTCYRKIRPRKNKKCSICKKNGVIKKNNKGKLICLKCYNQPKKICSMCNVEKEICDGGNVICRNCYNKHKRKNDKKFRIMTILRQRSYSALRLFGKGKVKKSDEYGINYLNIIKHLSPFPQNIEEYHVDHIFPLCAFDLSNPIEILAAFAPENHQWLKAMDNMIKNNKYNKKDFDKYLINFKEK